MKAAAGPGPLQPLLACAQFVRQRLTPGGTGYVTCAGNTDGIGAQVHARWSTLAYARAVGMQYVHSPFTSVAHRPPEAADWERQWESFFHVGAGERTFAEVAPAMRAVRQVCDATQIRCERDVLYVVPHCHTFTNLFPRGYLPLLDSFREKYGLSPKEPRPRGRPANDIEVAVHLRRGDVSPAAADRFTGNARVAAVIRSVAGVLQHAGYRAEVHVVSEGDERDFPELAACGATFHLNEDAFASFHRLVRADILLMAKSSFSYAAALLSRGIALYERFWHRPLPGWLVTGEAGLDRRQCRHLARCLAERTP